MIHVSQVLPSAEQSERPSMGVISKWQLGEGLLNQADFQRSHGGCAGCDIAEAPKLSSGGSEHSFADCWGCTDFLITCNTTMSGLLI